MLVDCVVCVTGSSLRLHVLVPMTVTRRSLGVVICSAVRPRVNVLRLTWVLV